MTKALLRTPAVAWPTLLLGLAVPIAWLLVVVAAFAGHIPLGVATVVGAVLAYLSFTPMHDASHKSVCRVRGVNEALGRWAGLPLLAPFPAFRAMHLAHHAQTNHPEHDPDFWSGTGPAWQLPLRWLTQDLHYYGRFFRSLDRYSRAEIIESAGGVALQFVGLAVAVALGHGWTFFFAVLLPARLGTAALAFAFDYLPHRPHTTLARDDRFRATHVFRERWLTPLLMGQNYHLVHHLYPGVPFYRYGKVWLDQRERLEARGASEQSVFARRPSADFGGGALGAQEAS